MYRRESRDTLQKRSFKILSFLIFVNATAGSTILRFFLRLAVIDVILHNETFEIVGKTPIMAIITGTALQIMMNQLNDLTFEGMIP